MSIEDIQNAIKQLKFQGEYVIPREEEATEEEPKVSIVDPGPSIDEKIKVLAERAEFEDLKTKDKPKPEPEPEPEPDYVTRRELYPNLYTQTEVQEEGVPAQYPQNLDVGGMNRFFQKYAKLSKQFKGKARPGSLQEQDEIINHFIERGYLKKSGKTFKADKEAMKGLATLDEHFRVAEMLNPGGNEKVKKMVGHLQDFAESEGIKLKISSIHRAADHDLSVQARSGGFTSDHEKGSAVDVARVIVDGKEYKYQAFIKRFPALYRALTKYMSKYYYLNEKEWGHGHFADNPRKNATKGARIDGVPFSEGREGYDISRVPEDNPSVPIEELERKYLIEEAREKKAQRKSTSKDSKKALSKKMDSNKEIRTIEDLKNLILGESNG